MGSIFFTCASYAQYWEAVNVDHGPMAGSVRRRLRPASWEPGRIDWLAAVIQFAGTLFFNISTFAATHEGLTAKQVDLRVWAPDVFGPICFLISAAASLIEPSANEPVNAHVANATTALGTLGFLIGAVLLFPEAARERAGPEPDAATGGPGAAAASPGP